MRRFKILIWVVFLIFYGCKDTLNKFDSLQSEITSIIENTVWVNADGDYRFKFLPDGTFVSYTYSRSGMEYIFAKWKIVEHDYVNYIAIYEYDNSYCIDNAYNTYAINDEFTYIDFVKLKATIECTNQKNKLLYRTMDINNEPLSILKSKYK